jgi:CRISPR-associated endonuclease/helicase Cas3
MDDQLSRSELARRHAVVAGAPVGAAPGTGTGTGERGLRGRTGEPGTPRGTPPDRNTRFGETRRGILSYAELAPLLGERVLACEEAIVTGAFAGQPLDEHLLLEFHRSISDDLVPDWAARWGEVVPVAELLALETLAFAEGRLLTDHPFVDFDGRVTRLWLLEILHRARLPQIKLTATGDAERNKYFAALEAADRLDWQPLSAIWQGRFGQLPPQATSS